MWRLFGVVLALFLFTYPTFAQESSDSPPFRNVSKASGFVAPRHGDGKTTGQAWGDYDQDGWLDIYVTDSGGPNILYRNNGDPDIYLVNDEFINDIGNVLWRNDGSGCEHHCFTNVSEEAGADTTVMGMGLATADYDADGDLDFYFSNAGPMTLLGNQGDGSFANLAVDATVERAAVAWGSLFFDYNNDGWLDLYLAVMEGLEGGSAANVLFEKNGDGSFADLGQASGAGDTGPSTGVAYADYDQDGRVDLVIGNYDDGYLLYRNESSEAEGHNWLAIKLVGDGPVNRDAVGARVVVTDGNGRSQMQEVKSGSSLGAGNSLILHFGLGSAEVGDVLVKWPDGFEQELGRLEANLQHTIQYGESPQNILFLPIGLIILAGVTLVAFLLWHRRSRSEPADIGDAPAKPSTNIHA